MGYVQPPAHEAQPPAEHRVHFGTESAWSGPGRHDERATGDTNRNLGDLLRLLSQLPSEQAVSVYGRVFPAPADRAGVTVIAAGMFERDIRQWVDLGELERLCEAAGFPATIQVLTVDQFSKRVNQVEVICWQAGRRIAQDPRGLRRFLGDQPWTVLITKPADWMLGAIFSEIGRLVLARVMTMRAEGRRREAAADERRAIGAGGRPHRRAGPSPSRGQAPTSMLGRLLAWLRRLLGLSARRPAQSARRQPPPPAARPTAPALQPLTRTSAETVAVRGNVFTLLRDNGVVLRLDPNLPDVAYATGARLRRGQRKGLRVLSYDSGARKWVPPQ